LRSRGLNPKHKKALELLQQGNLKISEVAKQSGLGTTQLYDLMVGDEHGGGVAAEFSAVYQKAMDDADRRINAKQKELKETVAEVLDKWVNEKKHKKLSVTDQKAFANIAKVYQAGPVYNIGSVSYSRGLNPEEMLNEFKRLRAAAEGALDRRTVLSTSEEGSGILPVSLGRGSKAEKVKETPDVSAESEAGTVSSE
jgi:AraC-like DNA-binding protein